MSYIALYRKWRPTTFTDVVEQQHVVRALQNTVTSRRIAHAYLFCGTRGTGKTTIAKIFARAINCLNPVDGNPCNECEICRGVLDESLLDVIEMDAASNNGVDAIRGIIDEVAYSPAKAEYKVYIIDEVHMLSGGAFNALLKTLEEPPKHAVFLLATTDPHKLPATILSRCQRFDFKRISSDAIVNRLTHICNETDISIEPSAATTIARLADGALRDAISILDQCVSIGGENVTLDVVKNVTGISNISLITSILQAIIDFNTNSIFTTIDTLIANGKDIVRFNTDLINYCRDVMICGISTAPDDLIDPMHDIELMKKQSAQLGIQRLTFILKELSELDNRFKLTTQPRILFETTLIRILTMTGTVDRSIEDRLKAIETRLANINFSNTVSPAPMASPTTAPTVSEQPIKNKNEDKKETQAKPKHLIPGEFADTHKVVSDLVAFQNEMLASFFHDITVYTISDTLLGLVCKNPVQELVLSNAHDHEVVRASFERVIGHPVDFKTYSSVDALPDAVPRKEKVSPSKSNGTPSLEDTASKIAEMADVPFEIEE